MEKHGAYAAKLTLPFPLLSDPGAATARAYGAKGLLMVKRTVVGIGKDGVIRYYRHGMPPDDEILAAMT